MAKGYSSPEPDIQDSSGSEGKNITADYSLQAPKLLKGYYSIMFNIWKVFFILTQEDNVGVWVETEMVCKKKAILDYR